MCPILLSTAESAGTNFPPTEQKISHPKYKKRNSHPKYKKEIPTQSAKNLPPNG